ncbi:MAG: hypothetical protein ABR559_05770 [Gemmatimonadota bacterium]
MSESQHLETETLYRLLDGRLATAADRRAEAHLLRCAACRALREECAATVSALRWYAAAPPAPPAGYWAAFWTALPIAGMVPDARPVPAGLERVPGDPSARAGMVRRYAPLACAASLAGVLMFGAGVWWSGSGGDPAGPPVGAALPPQPIPAAAGGPAGRPAGDSAWEDDWAYFDRVTYAIGSVDPLSKGVALAGLAEASRPATPEPAGDFPVGP